MNADDGMVRFDKRQDVRAAQIRLLYEQLASILVSTIIVGSILVAGLWSAFSRTVLLLWLFAILLVSLGRYIQRRAYFRTPLTPGDVQNYGRRYLYGVLANGVLWGVASFFFFIPDSYAHQLFLAFVLIGMVSGGISALSSSRRDYLAFLVPALLPYGARLLTTGGALHLAMAGLLVVYVTMMVIISHRLYSTVTESLYLRFENLDLLRSLTHAKDRMETANQELAAQIAEKRSAQDALQKAYSELEQRVLDRTVDLTKSEEALRNADKRKNEFLAMLGHELRNPLAPIRNALEVMNKPDASASGTKWAREVIERQIDRLARLVDDLLDVSRIMYGKINLHQTLLQISTVITHAVEESRSLIEAHQQTFSVRVPTEPLWIKGDLVRLEQVVSNLLSNAAKYSNPGMHITLDVEASEQWVTVRVKDNGIGIAPELLPHVFELFVQANHTLARAQGGLGIGLTVVKRLVEMHGGRIEALSKGSGCGSEFLVHLPRQQPPVLEELRVTPKNGESESEQGLRVLIVDDNQDAADTLALLMKLEGYTVTVAYSGVAALAEESKFHPQVVLLDIGMPGMDGYEVARQLKTRESGKSLIIVALTGYTQPEDKVRAEQAGFTDHLRKPLDLKLLQEVVKAHSHAKR